MKDVFGYQGKRVVITGAATGMGNAATQLLIDLGAEVYALDIKEVTTPVKKYIHTDLAKKDQIDAAVRQIPDSIHCLFNCAALPGKPFSDIDVMMVNFVAHRYLTETLLPRIGSGGAIATIASQAGTFWLSHFDIIKQLLATNGWEEARAWLEANPGNIKRGGYVFSKECLVTYAKMRAPQLAEKNIRMNCLSPGPTATPMMPAFVKANTKEVIDRFLTGIGRYATPEEMGHPLVFLNSDMARYISGVNLFVDYGWEAAVATGQRKPF